jgi:two-component system chemotaxis response regulator CheB
MSAFSRRIRVLIVDDSPIVRRILSGALEGEPDLEVVGAFPDPVAAKRYIPELAPDVLTLDIEMPRMDGITFLREMMATAPIPAIVISSVAQQGCERAMQALEAGAVEVLAKPGGPFSVSDLRLALPNKVRAAAHARLPRPSPAARPPAKATALPDVQSGSGTLVAIGASTGGTEAIREVLERLPAAFPPVVVVQHIPPGFSRSFAERLNSRCSLSVREASDGDAVGQGTVLVAPGDQHMVLQRRGRNFSVRLNSGPRVCYQRPSVDVLFQSVAATAGANAIGVILTGMGNDGAAGLLRMKQAGAQTLAQDEATCVVYGMPKEAVRAGAVDSVLHLTRIAEAICRLVRPVSAAGRVM